MFTLGFCKKNWDMVPSQYSRNSDSNQSVGVINLTNIRLNQTFKILELVVINVIINELFEK